MPNSKLSTEDQNEINVLQFAIEQLNHYSYREEVAEILIFIQGIIAFGGFKSNLQDGHIDENEAYQRNMASLRAKLLELYKQEGKLANVVIDPLFYHALFSFLLLLAKYTPTNQCDNDNELLCPASKLKIKSNSRLLFIGGAQYDHHYNPPNYCAYNPYDKERTEFYTALRRKALVDHNSSKHEIIQPIAFEHSNSRPRVSSQQTGEVAMAGLFSGLLAGMVTALSIGASIKGLVDGIIVALILGSMFGGVFVGALIGFGAAFALPHIINGISKCIAKKLEVPTENTEDLFSYIQSHGIKPILTAQPEMKNENPNQELPPPYLPEIASRLSDRQDNLALALPATKENRYGWFSNLCCLRTPVPANSSLGSSCRV